MEDHPGVIFRDGPTWSSRGRNHAGLIYLANRLFPSDRSFVGAIVTAVDEVIASRQLPSDGAETYLRRKRA